MAELKLAVRDLRAGYGGREVLHGVEADLAAGQVTALLGYSGCGKTTLLKCLNRIIEEEGGYLSGRITLDGAETGALSREVLRARVGLVFQTPVIFPGSIEQNIRYARAYHFPGKRRELDEATERFLRQCGLWEEVADRLGGPASALSVGQRQRLAMARCLCTEPEVLLLDEPCAALDMQNTARIEGLIARLRGRYTILIVTHNLAQARRVADRVLFMAEGRVLEARETAAFFSEPETEQAKEYLTHMER